MYGPNFQLEHLLNTIITAKPKSITVGTHHYVQLAESELLANANPEDLASLEYIAPAGAAVPPSCAALYHKKCPNLKVISHFRIHYFVNYSSTRTVLLKKIDVKTGKNWFASRLSGQNLAKVEEAMQIGASSTCAIFVIN